MTDMPNENELEDALIWAALEGPLESVRMTLLSARATECRFATFDCVAVQALLDAYERQVDAR